MSWRRLRPKELCPICGHLSWCTVTTDGEIVKCMRTPSQYPVINKRTGEVLDGHIHILRGVARRPRTAAFSADNAPRISRVELILMQREFVRAVVPASLADHAQALGVSVASLRALRIGWYAERRAWTFPMTDADGDIVGIRVRKPLFNGGAAKWSIAGGSEGLFVATEMPKAGVIIVCEGPTSAAAWLDIGFPVIGRPSCTGGNAILRKVLKDELRSVVVVADRDARKKRTDGSFFYPGQDGAASLTEQLSGVCRARCSVCPVSKDGRDWLKQGVTKLDVMDWIRTTVTKTEEAKQSA